MSISSLAKDPADTAPAPEPEATPVAPGLYRRILRRETHSSRSGAAVVVLIVLLLVAAYIGVESVYAALGKPALLVSPNDVLATLLTAATSQAGIVIAAGIVTGIVGIILLIIAFKPGRRGRHTIDDPRVAVVVDDQVIAASLSHRARLAGGLGGGQVTSWVARSQAHLTVTPASGAAVDETAIVEAARDELDSIGYRPAVKPSVRVTDNGRLGA